MLEVWLNHVCRVGLSSSRHVVRVQQCKCWQEQADSGVDDDRYHGGHIGSPVKLAAWCLCLKQC